MVACGRGAKWVVGWWAMVGAAPLGVGARSSSAARAWCGVIAGVVKGESTMGHAPVWSMGVAMVRVGVGGPGGVECGEYSARVCAVRGVLPEASGRPNGAKLASEPFPNGRPFFAKTAMNCVN